MKKVFHFMVFITVFLSLQTSVYAKPINEADTKLCDTLTYALINSLSKPINQAIDEIYKNDEQAPDVQGWASYQTEILR
ncbi:hypothetical protein KO561_14480 [Radiobacillus kanasensis]|uniref:hypothetical protein n=1 Tax=Radiobacillus kanasensis TaxID=2844358 RepID=UPI001E57733B|nr:hypothetical protein [Radiobacillus kanasensis]UFT98398.1 hypothetical protein KO561_14480 [Radiobacillus kanasensis]